jgi:signal transduction histidine kinase/CheY-like chemotaxis protein
MSTPANLPIGNQYALGALFNSLYEGVIIWDSSGILVFANTAARDITRLNLLPGTPLAPELSHIRILADDNTPAALESLPVYRAFKGENVPNEMMRFIDRNGTHKWLFVSARRITDDAGKLLYVMSTLRDVSLRKSREDKLHFMVESAKILSLNLDFDQRLIEKAKLTVPRLADWCSINVLQNGELRRVTVIHQDPKKAELLTKLDEKFPRHGIMQVIHTQEPILIKVMTDEDRKSRAQSPEHLEGLRELAMNSLMIIPIVSRGEGVGAMTLAYGESGRTYDETDLAFFQEFCYHLSLVFDNARLFTQIEQRDKAKDIFLAALSHELRNPLAPIKSALELLKLRGVPPDVKDELDVIEHQFDHMSHLLHDLLDVTRFTQDRISLSPRPIELRRLVERALRGSDALLRKSEITLHFTYPSTPISVFADETRMEQAVSNLLNNAIKFTPSGGSIWVDVEHTDSRAIVRVRDNGAGIDPDDLPHIFDMYYQGTNIGPGNGGLGIGLLLVQRIVAMHNGTVTAESEGRDCGSQFTIGLPLTEIAVADRTQHQPGERAKNLRILVVDDNAPAADALVRLLNKMGANANAAYSAHEALGSELLHEIDLFLLDVGMPHMDGYELVAALRKRGISAPIIALTGYGLAEDKQRALDAGFSSHLTKPVGLQELNTMFESVLSVSA